MVYGSQVTPGRRRVSRAALSYAGALLVALLLWRTGGAFLRLVIQHRATSAFAASAAWGLLLLVSFAGWGAALNAAVFRRKRADWGLRGAWGWAAVTALGGLLCALQLATRGVLVLVVGVGLVAFGVAVVREYLAWARRNVLRWARSAWEALPFGLGAAAVFALGLVPYLASIVSTNFNGNDDKLCYFAFARGILDRGTLSQPFSLRRVSAYGAKSVLDAFQLAIPVPETHLHLLDNGMALLAVLALLVGHTQTVRRASRGIVLLLLLLTVTLPDIRINTATTMTGVVFFLGLYRTLVWQPVREGTGFRPGIPVALLAAGACALRQNYLVPIAVFLGLEYGAPLVRGLRFRPFAVERTALVRAWTTAAALVVFLAPWWAMSLRWSRTFLFPFMRGNFDPGYSFFEPLKRFEELHYVWANACYCLPVKAVPLFLVAALTGLDRSRRSTIANFAIAAFAGFAILLKSYPDADAPNLGRYYFGFTFAALLAIALAVAEAAGRRSPSGAGPRRAGRGDRARRGRRGPAALRRSRGDDERVRQEPHRDRARVRKANAVGDASTRSGLCAPPECDPGRCTHRGHGRRGGTLRLSPQPDRKSRHGRCDQPAAGDPSLRRRRASGRLSRGAGLQVPHRRAPRLRGVPVSARHLAEERDRRSAGVQADCPPLSAGIRSVRQAPGDAPQPCGGGRNDCPRSDATSRVTPEDPIVSGQGGRG